MNVLDHGSVILVDHMASDVKVVGAARVSTGKAPEDASKGPEADGKLIAFLMEHGHGTPFEHAVFQFYVKAPIFVVREWQRHRIASYNEQSGRYAEFAPEFYVPDHIRVQDPANKQSSIRVGEDHTFDFHGDVADSALQEHTVVEMFDDHSQDAYGRYHDLIEAGVAREMARIVLPLNLYTSFWFTVNARSLMNFLALRNHPAAQWEIRQYAEAIEAMFAEVMPLTHTAFVKAGRAAP